MFRLLFKVKVISLMSLNEEYLVACYNKLHTFFFWQKQITHLNAIPSKKYPY
jgi:hypothetical protein